MCNERSLRSLFPEFIWSKEGDMFLNAIKEDRLRLQEQMRLRCVCEIKILPLLCGGGIICDKAFFVVIFNDTLEESQKSALLGHELGHTFHLLIKNGTVVDLESERATNKDLYERVEEFCDEFSQRWLETNGQSLVQIFIQHSSSPFF